MDELATAATLWDLTKLTLIVVGLTRVFNEIVPDAPVRYIRLACYAFSLVASALAVWTPDLSIRQYAILTIHNALVIGTGAIGAIATFERTPKPETPDAA